MFSTQPLFFIPFPPSSLWNTYTVPFEDDNDIYHLRRTSTLAFSFHPFLTLETFAAHVPFLFVYLFLPRLPQTAGGTAVVRRHRDGHSAGKRVQ